MTGATVIAFPARAQAPEPPVMSPALLRRYGSVTGLLAAATRQLAGHVAAGRLTIGIAEAAVWNTVLHGERTGELRGDAEETARQWCAQLRRRVAA